MKKLYFVEVEFNNEAKPKGDEVDTIEFAIPASSFAEAEEKATKEAGESLIKICSIYESYHTYLG